MVHFVLLLFLVFIIVFLAGLALLASSSTLRGAFTNRFIWSTRVSFTDARLDDVVLWSVTLVPLLPLLVAWKWRLRFRKLLLMLPVGVVILAGWWLFYEPLGGLVDRVSVQTLIRIVFFGFLAALGFWLAWRFRNRSWWWVTGGALAVAPVLTYLAVDDTSLRHSMSIEEIAPAFPGAEKSYGVLMRYGKDHPLGRAFKTPRRVFPPGLPAFMDDPKRAEERRVWLLARRAEIEADWAELGPVRSWWSELHAFDRIGDLTPARFDAEIINFEPPRAYSQRAAAIAGLQALDGEGDAAFETLLPLLEVSRKLEPSARTLVRFMIARVCQKLALDAAGFVLDHATVSAANRARFLAALKGGSGGEAGARRLVAIEYASSREPYSDIRLGEWMAQPFLGARHLLNILGPLVYNPRKTINLFGDLTEQWQNFAARREIDKIEPATKEFFRTTGRPRLKNLLGSIVLVRLSPSYSRVLENYWKIEDARAALRERLEKMETTGPL